MSNRPRVPTYVLVIVFAICVGTVVALVHKPGSSQPAVPRLADVRVIGHASSSKRAAFFSEQIAPELESFDAANQDAVQRASRRIDGLFNEFRSGVPLFVEDITSIRTRLGIVARMPGDYWYEDDRIREFIHTKFETHIFSEDSLRMRIEQIIAELHRDLLSNRNVLLVNTSEELARDPDLGLDGINVAAFSAMATDIITDYLSTQASESVEDAIVVEILSGVAGAAAGKVATQVLASASVAIGTKLVAVGGSTVAGAGAGGTAGLLGGPVGVGVGIAVGILAGVAVDMWMNDRLQERLESELNVYLSDLKNELAIGSDGLIAEFQRSANEMSQAHERAFRELMIGSD